MTTTNDDDGLIAEIPDLRIECSLCEDTVVLEQRDYSGETARILLHATQVRLIAEHLGMRQGLKTTQESQVAAERERTKRAEAMVVTLQRRMLILKGRIEHLDEGLWANADPECADITIDRGFSDATADFAREFCHGFELGERIVDDGPTAPSPKPGPLKRRLGVTVAPGESPERVAMEAFRDFVKKNKPLLMLVAHWGDDRCGALLNVLMEELLGRPFDGHPMPTVTAPSGVVAKAAATDPLFPEEPAS